MFPQPEQAVATSEISALRIQEIRGNVGQFVTNCLPHYGVKPYNTIGLHVMQWRMQWRGSPEPAGKMGFPQSVLAPSRVEVLLCFVHG